MHIPIIKASPAFTAPNEGLEDIYILNSYPLPAKTLFKKELSKIKQKIYFTVKQQPFKQSFNAFELPCIKENQKLIYVNFGTCIGKHKGQDYVSKIYSYLIDSFNNDNNYIFILGNVSNKITIPYTPQNFYIYYELVPQKEILNYADLFISHGGPNGANEALIEEVPMISIPFFGDQNSIAEVMQITQCGISFLKDDPSKNTVYDRSSLTQNTLKNTILKILNNTEYYKENIRKMKQEQPQDFTEIIEEILQDLS